MTTDPVLPHGVDLDVDAQLAVPLQAHAQAGYVHEHVRARDTELYPKQNERN